MLKMIDLDLTGKRLLIRSYLCPPVKDGKFISTDRIKESLATIDMALKSGGKVMVLSHAGGATEGEYNDEFSLRLMADYLCAELGVPVRLVQDYLDGVEVAIGELVVLENCLFNQGEKKNSDDLARRYAALCDIFVMDDAAIAHQTWASTHGIAKFAPVACAGPSLVSDLDAANKFINIPERPLVALGGYPWRGHGQALIKGLSQLVDHLLVGNKTAEMFIAAAGHNYGRHACCPELVDGAKALASTCNIPAITDVVASKDCNEGVATAVKPIGELDGDDDILDIGPETAQRFAALITSARTIICYGELSNYLLNGSRTVAHAMAASQAFFVCLDGHALEQLKQCGVTHHGSYVPKGAVLSALLSGDEVPVVTMLKERAITFSAAHTTGSHGTTS